MVFVVRSVVSRGSFRLKGSAVDHRLGMIKQQLKQALLSSGVLRLAGRLHGKGAAILMYHSVLEDPGSVADSPAISASRASSRCSSCLRRWAA